MRRVASRPAPRGRGGLTLLEVMVALALAGLVLALLLGYVRAARGASTAAETRSEAELTLRLAVELLREELRLAGAAPWPPPVAVVGTDAPAAFLQQPLRLAPTARGASVRVRYLDHRLAGAPVARDHTYEAGVDGSGAPQLYRRADGGARQPLLAGVTRFAVVGGVSAGGAWLSAEQLPGRRVRALELVVEVGLDARRFLVELPAWPQVTGP